MFDFLIDEINILAQEAARFRAFDSIWKFIIEINLCFKFFFDFQELISLQFQFKVYSLGSQFSFVVANHLKMAEVSCLMLHIWRGFFI